MSNEIKGGEGNNYTAEFWEYDPRIGRRWNLDPRPVVGASEYSAFANNPILNADPLGDTIRTRATAEVTNTTLNQKGGVVDKVQEAIEYKDAKLVPAYTNGGQLVGYHVWDMKNQNAKNYLLQIEPGDIDEFKKRYDNGLMNGARLLYSKGELTPEDKKIAAGIETENFGLMWEGIKDANKKAWSDPVFVVSFLTSSMHAGLSTFSSIRSYDSFKDFKKTEGSAGAGNAWHHIVEQNPANIAQFGNRAIHNTKNLIILPHGAGTLHNKVSGYYSSKQPFTGGLTVRKWISTKSYKEQYEFGIKTLKSFGWKP